MRAIAQATVVPENRGYGKACRAYFTLAQKRWMRLQASSSTEFAVA